MAKRKSTKQHGFIDKILESLSGIPECEEIEVDNSYRLSERKVRLNFDNYPVQINIGRDGKALHIYPELPIKTDEQSQKNTNYIIFDPKTYYKGVSGFIRVKHGEQLTLGKDYKELLDILNLPQSIAKNQLTIINDNGQLVFKSTESKYSSCISPLVKHKQLNRVRKLRIAKLKRIRAIFGGPIKALEKDDALTLIKSVNKIMSHESYRKKNSKGKPGGVIKLPSSVKPILVGDLHTKADNLLLILSQGGFLKALKKGTAALVILGDAVHCEEEGHYEEMDSSIVIMDLIFKLKLRFPNQVFYVRGNHDSFSEEIGKRGIPQGMLWEKALIDARGKEYRDEMERYYNQLPYIVYSDNFVSCHAGPPTASTSYDELVNVHQHPKLMHELTHNRIRKPHKVTGYFKKEIKAFRKYFNLKSNTPVIVGHTPLTHDDTLWEQVGEIDEHYIIYAGDHRWVSVMAETGDTLYPYRFPTESLIPVINELED